MGLVVAWLAAQLGANQWLWPVIAITSSVGLCFVAVYAVVISVRYQRLESSVVRLW